MSTSKEIFEPSGDARHMAGLLRNWFTALVEAGFTREEALDIVKAMLIKPQAQNG